ncbi:unnamed protein product [Mycena citricolor]|uniref:Uncharacterized protein n=1 Tax=Mycena citricolor TaxID=2018698 RepID=A0AAD2HQZ8_9AGAR|nr:unnamed protein product [Mycena citricolor]
MRAFSRVVSLLALAVRIQLARGSTVPGCPDLGSLPPQDVFDYIVVGSGAGGGPLAARLAENGFSVLVVEAGDDVWKYNTSIPAFWPRATEDPQLELAYDVVEYSTPGSRVAWYPRSRGIGGSTLHNAMINVIGGTKADFDSVSTMFDDPSWTRTNMQSYYKKIEHNEDLIPPLLTAGDHGFDGWLETSSLPYLDLLNHLDILDPQLIALVSALALTAPPILDLNSVSGDGSAGLLFPSFTINSTRERSSVYARLKSVQRVNEPKLQFITDTLATRVLLCQPAASGSQPKAYGVEIAPGAALPVALGNFAGKQNLAVQNVYAKREVILSAGVFQSPQLLMLSGIGKTTQLAEFGIDTVVDLPGVGANLQDHDEITIIWNLTQKFKFFDGCTFQSNRSTDPCLADWLDSGHHNIYSFDPVLNAFLTTSDPGLSAPNMFTYLSPVCVKGIVPNFAEDAYSHPNALSAIVLLAHPSSRGSVTLTGPHPQDPLSIHKRHFEAPGGDADIRALVGGLEAMRKFASSSLISGFIDKEIFPGPNVSLRDHVLQHVFGHHLCCTNKMGVKDDKMAVLDGDFRVYGVDALRVVDLSSWADVPGFFVTTPTYMISEKAADSIMNDARSSGRP